MKVICIDNFNRDYISDSLVRENLTDEEADKLVKEHNDQMSAHCQDYFKKVSDDHKSYIFEP